MVPQYRRVPEITQSVLRQRSTYLALVGCLLLTTTLTACGKTLEVSKIQEAIKEDVIKKGATSLKSVFCPKDVQPEAGKTFECIGELDGGNAFAINVKQEDAAGKVQWDIPNAKGILNLDKLQAIFLASIKTEPGAPPEINCGGIYRAVKPGDSFDCVVTPKASAKSADKKVTKAEGVNSDVAPSKDLEATKVEDKSKSINIALGVDQTKVPDSAVPNDKSTAQASNQKNADHQEANKSDPAKSSEKTEKSKSTNKSSQGNSAKVLPGQLIAIRVSVDVDGNITWQQILEDPNVQIAATTPVSTTAATESTTGTAAADALGIATSGKPGETAVKPEDATPPVTKLSPGTPPSSAETQNIED